MTVDAGSLGVAPCGPATVEAGLPGAAPAGLTIVEAGLRGSVPAGLAMLEAGLRGIEPAGLAMLEAGLRGIEPTGLTMLEAGFLRVPRPIGSRSAGSAANAACGRDAANAQTINQIHGVFIGSSPFLGRWRRARAKARS